MAARPARAALQPWRAPLRRAPVRHASSATEAASSGASQAKEGAANTASKAKEGAANATSKASQGLSRVQSSAGSMMSRAGPAISNTLNGIGGRTGRLINFVQSLVPPTVYYARVGGELARTTWKAQGMAPPSVAQLQSYTQPLMNGIRNPQSLFSANPGVLQPQQYLEQARNMNREQMVQIGIIVAQVIGFYEVGKMIGRMKIVGYRSGTPKEEVVEKQTSV